jgi:hypothetical protein
LVDEFPSRGHRLIFDDLDRREVEPRNPADKTKSWYRPVFEIVTSNPQHAAQSALMRVAAAAYRRPVTTAEMDPFVELFVREMDDGSSFEDSLKTSLTAVLVSPEFLYLRENSGRLDDHSLATRLSYFLTRSSPDRELRQAADDGFLTKNGDALALQTERLLGHPHHDRWIRDFTDTWLNLREMDFTMPDGVLFPEFDPFLKHSMTEETRAFLRTLIEFDLSVTNAVKSDFALLNNRLAEHYGIDGVVGPEMRQVTLPQDSVRGGFLSQGSILKVSANGTNTSPVVRGVWVM